MATIAHCLQLAQNLVEISQSPRLDVEVLLAKALGKTRTYLYTWPENEMSADAYDCFLGYLQRRQKGEPVAYIIGEKEFWSLPILVDKNVLIPRSETELLVESALSLYGAEEQRSITVADLGTGTGAIALALASERPHWTVYAIDKSAAATVLAELNCRQLQVQNVRVIQSDWCAALGLNLDLIVSNPPYIAANDQHLNEGDVRFEPNSALVADGDGLADIEQVVAQSYHHLSVGGWLLLEHGYNQASAVLALLEGQGFSHCFVRRDLGGNERVSGGRK